MKEIKVLSFAKINLSIDVGPVMENGFHEVDMIMQQLSFHDDVTVSFTESNEFSISLGTNRYYLPVDGRNLSYKAAELMIAHYGNRVKPGKIDIRIFKRIPVAAGMAGGSGNGAAVLHALNALWNLDLSLTTLEEIAMELGSDVPFSVRGQARCNFVLPAKVRKDPKASSCARATGRGTELDSIKGIRKFVVIAKPHLSVSTAEVYKGIDSCVVLKRPDNDRLAKALKSGEEKEIYIDFVNVLENYTLNAYPKVKTLKGELIKTAPDVVLMSGSGPTVFALYSDIAAAKQGCQAMRDLKYEAYWTKTTR